MTVVVTGATQGIGLVAAEAMAAMGAQTIITARDAARGEKARAHIVAAAGHDDVHVVDVGFASMASIRQGAAQVRGLTDRVHVLLNNVGAIFTERAMSRDGLELTFATNHIGYFLWTHELLDVVKGSAPARIVNVSSLAHRAASGVAFDDLERRRGYSGIGVYGETKLMNILFTRALARRLDGTGVTVNAIHPGAIASGFGTNNTGVFGFATRHLGRFVLATPEKGARTSIYVCTSPDVAGTTGAYFANCRRAKTSRVAEDDAAAARLWELSETVCGIRSSATNTAA
jgi:NAD(P)-dependent dehydrogenase (short-subunit alcohol dehydrogenase family)